MVGTVLCKDCDFVTHDGYCLIFCKMTMLDIPHQCDHFRANLRKFRNVNPAKRRNKCSVISKGDMGDWNGIPLTEYVFGCGDASLLTYAFFLEDAPEPTTCPFCGGALK